jgi:hypothetical protein
MRVGLIGLGHVGALMRGLFGGHAELVEYDVATHSAYPKSELGECDFAVVSVVRTAPATPLMCGMQ